MSRDYVKGIINKFDDFDGFVAAIRKDFQGPTTTEYNEFIFSVTGLFDHLDNPVESRQESTCAVFKKTTFDFIKNMYADNVTDKEKVNLVNRYNEASKSLDDQGCGLAKTLAKAVAVLAGIGALIGGLLGALCGGVGAVPGAAMGGCFGALIAIPVGVAIHNRFYKPLPAINTEQEEALRENFVTAVRAFA